MAIGTLAKISVLLCCAVGGVDAAEVLLFKELFEDRNWESRGWYDGPHMQITGEEQIPGSGHSCVWHWQKKGDTGTAGGGARVQLPPVDEGILSFHIKHGAEWAWTGVDWHPHEFHFIISADDEYVGPAYTHLTFYIEAVNGVPRVGIQDGRNIDERMIGENLAASTEYRSVAGCNGDADGYGAGDCYQAGDVHRNGKAWEAG